MTSPQQLRPDSPYASTQATPPTPQLEPDVRLARLVADVTARLRPVCAGMPPSEFDALVRDIAAMKLRWAAEG